MTEYKIYIYGRIKDGHFCRFVFQIDANGQEQFLKAISKKPLNQQVEMSHIAATRYVKSQKLRLIDEFQI